MGFTIKYYKKPMINLNFEIREMWDELYPNLIARYFDLLQVLHFFYTTELNALNSHLYMTKLTFYMKNHTKINWLQFLVNAS